MCFIGGSDGQVYSYKIQDEMELLFHLRRGLGLGRIKIDRLIAIKALDAIGVLASKKI